MWYHSLSWCHPLWGDIIMNVCLRVYELGQNLGCHREYIFLWDKFTLWCSDCNVDEAVDVWLDMGGIVKCQCDIQLFWKYWEISMVKDAGACEFVCGVSVLYLFFFYYLDWGLMIDRIIWYISYLILSVNCFSWQDTDEKFLPSWLVFECYAL